MAGTGLDRPGHDAWGDHYGEPLRLTVQHSHPNPQADVPQTEIILANEFRSQS